MSYIIKLMLYQQKKIQIIPGIEVLQCCYGDQVCCNGSGVLSHVFYLDRKEGSQTKTWREYFLQKHFFFNMKESFLFRFRQLFRVGSVTIALILSNEQKHYAYVSINLWLVTKLFLTKSSLMTQTVKRNYLLA